MLSKSPTFCILPWVHQMVDPTGRVQLCCASVHDDELGPATNMVEAWNSDAMRDIRLRMLEGREVAACSRCYSEERSGDNSYRMLESPQWENNDDVIDLFKRSLDNGLHVDSMPYYIDFRFGNLCNLSCKMCGSEYSSQVLKNNKKLQQYDKHKFRLYVNDLLDDDQVWNQSPAVMELMRHYISDVQTVYLAGGEPTIADDNIKFLKLCIEMGRSSQIKLRINSNLTNINAELLDIIGQFKEVVFNCSIDGSNDIQEYIRYPSKWEMVVKNFHRLWNDLPAGNTVFINLVAQAYNILNLPEILDDLLGLHDHVADPNRHHFRISITPLFFPTYFNISNLPKSIKVEAHHRLTTWKHLNCNNKKRFAPDWVDINSLLSRLVDPPTALISPIYNFNRMMFKECTTPKKLETSIPELYAFMREEASNTKGLDLDELAVYLGFNADR